MANRLNPFLNIHIQREIDPVVHIGKNKSGEEKSLPATIPIPLKLSSSTVFPSNFIVSQRTQIDTMSSNKMAEIFHKFKQSGNGPSKLKRKEEHEELWKTGGGTINPSTLTDMIQSAKKIGVSLITKLDEMLAKEQDLGQTKQGFFA
jgi:hypothetical protein